jgi:hypothetical protein
MAVVLSAWRGAVAGVSGVEATPRRMWGTARVSIRVAAKRVMYPIRTRSDGDCSSRGNRAEDGSEQRVRKTRCQQELDVYICSDSNGIENPYGVNWTGGEKYFGPTRAPRKPRGR